MSLEGVLRDVDAARSQLKQAGVASSAWSDKQRQEFDGQRIGPLDNAGKSLHTALSRAVDQYRAAMQLLGDQR